MGSALRGHLASFGRNILELLVYYLMPNKCKNLKIRSLLVCLSVLVAFKITKVDISCIITCNSGPHCSKSVYRPVRRAPVSKFGCMSLRSAAFCIDSGQLRFAMMRNLTVILRDLNLGAWRPRQIDKTSLSRGRVVTFVLSS